MKQTLLLFLFVLISLGVYGQVFSDSFDDGLTTNTYYGQNFSGTESAGEWVVTGNGNTGAYELFGYSVKDATGAPATVDITGNHKVYLRAKASNLGTKIRLDVKDKAGYVTSLAGITKTMVNEYLVLEFDFSGQLNDGGYGGTPCATGPCPVNGKEISEFQFYINGGTGGFGGVVKIDFLSVGSQPQVGPMSDVFQDQFDDPISLKYMGSSTAALVNVVEDGNWKIVGDGNGGAYEPVAMLLYNPTTLDTTDVSCAAANDKIYIRMRSTVPGTSVRLDLQDINSMATTAGSINKLITQEYKTYEYNFAGSYSDLAYGGTGCSAGPCPVDAERIANMIIFINQGSGAFLGEVQIDYISYGTALEVVDGNENQLVYGDHFSKDAKYVSTSASYGLSVAKSNLKITGTGVDGAYTAISYKLNEKDAGVDVNVTGNNKMFIKAKCNKANTLMRVDLVDSSGFVTSQASFTRLLTPDYTVFEINFDAAYVDAGYGGTACATGPCPVDGKAIRSVLLYPNPADGAFEGDIEIDYISFGAPMGEDIQKYADQFDNGDKTKWSDANGFTVTEKDGFLELTGDGTAGAYAAFSYIPHNQTTNEDLTLNLVSNNKLYVRAKSSVAGVPLRIDLVDAAGFVTSEPAVVRNVTGEYSVLEYDFSGTYTDGGYGGTPCTTAPCPVDGTNLARFLFYVDPANGKFNGTVTLDWFSTLEPLEVIPENPVAPGVKEYKDEFTDNATNFFAPNGGLSLSAADGEIKVKGDGTSGQYAPIIYEMHKGADSLLVDVTSTKDDLYVRAKSSTPTTLRFDLQDYKGYLTSLAGITNNVGTEYATLKYSYAGKYSDGGYGGTPCTAGPCAVDGKRIEKLQIYIAPGTGAYNGDLAIDWISFGEPITVDVVDYSLAQFGKIYPNPATSELYLELQTLVSGDLTFELTDMTGRIVKTVGFSNIQEGNNGVKISLENINAGFYLASAKINGKKVFVNKIVVNK
jgi:hypothetical protein